MFESDLVFGTTLTTILILR